MSRPPFPLALWLALGCALPGSLRAQATPPPVDPAAVLATLKDLRTRQPNIVHRETAGVLDAINAAMADPAKAYEEAMTAVEFEGNADNSANGGNSRSNRNNFRNHNGSGSSEGARVGDFRSQMGELLRNRDFVNGLRLQLLYLSLTFQHQTGTKMKDQLNPLLEYTNQVAGTEDALAGFEVLHKPIGETVFAKYFQVAPYLAGMTKWEEQPLEVEGIYGKAILPEMRVEKDPRLLSYWDGHIQNEGARAEASQNALLQNKFKNIRLPELLWGRAEDEIILDQKNQGITDMVAIVKAHPDHPDFQRWAARIEELVTAPPPTPSPTPVSVPPAGAPSAPPVTP